MIEAVFSCVVDDVPAIWKSVVPWLATATTLAGVPPDRIYLHHVCGLPIWLAQLCERLGVNVRPVDPFDPQNPHTNKIQQCATDFGSAEIAVLSDVDLVFTEPLPLDRVKGVVAGKLVDRANPPLEMLQAIFAQASVSPIGTCSNGYVDGQEEFTFETVVGNFNGGLYIVPRSELPAIGEAWACWARWLADHPGILGKWKVHLDQVAFCLALNELRSTTRILDDRWNYPTREPVRPLNSKPFALHHHAMLDEDSGLFPLEDPQAQAAREVVNRSIKDFRRTYRWLLQN